jgi:hypothetical protein
MTCKIEGCGGVVVARRLCAKHYMRWKRTGDALKTGKPGRKPDPTKPTADAREVAALRARIRELEAELVSRVRSSQH